MADGRGNIVEQCIKACIILLSVTYSFGQQLNTACFEMKKVYAEKGFNDKEVPMTAISGKPLLPVMTQKYLCVVRYD